MPRRARTPNSDESAVVDRRKSKSQAKGKKRARASRGSDDEGSDDQGEGTSKKKSKKQKHADFSEDMIVKKAQDFVRLALFSETKRRPLKRDEISKLRSAKNFNKVLSAAQKIANETLGMDLIELRAKGKGVGSIPVRDEPEEGASQAAKKKKKQRKEDSSSGEDDELGGGRTKKVASGPKLFMLRSNLPDNVIAALGKTSQVAGARELEPEDQALNYSRVEGFQEQDVKAWREDDGAAIDWKHSDQLQHIGILHVLLALILVNERKVTSRACSRRDELTATEQLYSMLRILQIEEKTRLPSTPAAASLNIMTDKFTFESYLKELRTAGYLESREPLLQSTNAKDPDKLEWRWGARAEAEIGEKNIGEFIAEIMLQRQVEPDEDGRKKLLGAVHKAAGSKLQPVTSRSAATD